MYVLALLGCHYLVYTAGGYLTAFLISFFLNLRFTFAVNGNIKKRLLTFVSINIVNLLQVELIEIILIEYAKQPHLLAIFVGMIWYVIFGFLMNQKYVFQAHPTTI
jgi:putative flippase GtrA